jgi:uncharacterized protein (UPF0264 family)
MRLLVSVRSEAEALLAARGGADFIDLKEPHAGALGGLPTTTIRSIVQALHERGIALPVSATIGDLPMQQIDHIAACVNAVGACGGDYVKVGIELHRESGAVLDMLGACSFSIVPVFIADHGLDFDLVERACALGFPAVMADTADKRVGSLFDCASAPVLPRFVETVRRAGKLVGLAGALRVRHLAALMQLAPDFAGFRSAVCVGDRSSALDPQRVRGLADLLRPQAPKEISGAEHPDLAEQQ